MTNTLTRSKLMSYSHDNIFDTINNRSNVSDPKNPNNLIRKFVYKNDPFSKGNDYDGHPYIIVRFPKIEYDNVSVDGNHKNIMFSCELTVRTAMGGAVNDSGSAGITDMNSIIDDLHETFNSQTVKDELRLLSMYNFNIMTVENDEFVDSNGKHIFESILELNFMTRMKTGAS